MLMKIWKNEITQNREIQVSLKKEKTKVKNIGLLTVSSDDEMN